MLGLRLSLLSLLSRLPGLRLSLLLFLPRLPDLRLSLLLFLPRLPDLRLSLLLFLPRLPGLRLSLLLLLSRLPGLRLSLLLLLSRLPGLRLSLLLLLSRLPGLRLSLLLPFPLFMFPDVRSPCIFILSLPSYFLLSLLWKRLISFHVPFSFSFPISTAIPTFPVLFKLLVGNPSVVPSMSMPMPVSIVSSPTRINIIVKIGDVLIIDPTPIVIT